jgi:hypothetical protein
MPPYILTLKIIATVFAKTLESVEYSVWHIDIFLKAETRFGSLHCDWRLKSCFHISLYWHWSSHKRKRAQSNAGTPHFSVTDALILGACMYSLQAHDGSVTALTYSASYVISLGTDERLCVWERFQGHLLNTIQVVGTVALRIMLVLVFSYAGILCWVVYCAHHHFI